MIIIIIKLCKSCGQLNYDKRNQECDMTGLIILVTGARVKIGYQVALKFLRNGATLIGNLQKVELIDQCQPQHDFHRMLLYAFRRFYFPFKKDQLF